MVGDDGLLRRQLAGDDAAHQRNERQRPFGVVDLAPEERDARTRGFGAVEQLEGVARRALAAAEDADDQAARVVLGKLLGRAPAVVGDLQENRLFFGDNAGKRTHDAVADERADPVGRNADIEHRVEYFQQVTQSVARCLLAERRIGFERAQVVVDVVGEGHRIEAEIGNPLQLGEARGAEWARGFHAVGAAAWIPDVGGVVVTHGRGDRRVLEQSLVLQDLRRRDAGQHDVDEAGLRHVAHRLQEHRAGRQMIEQTAGRIARRAGAGDAEGHVRVFGVGHDEVGRGVVSGADACKFLVKAFHCGFSSGRGVFRCA